MHRLLATLAACHAATALCASPTGRAALAACRPVLVRSGRRRLLSGAAAAAAAALAAAGPASAMDIGPVLTSRALEFVRIIEQENADNTLYGGELAQIGSTVPKALALVPIITVRTQIEALGAAVAQEGGAAGVLVKADGLFRSPEYKTKQLKKEFNAYSDNIYYTADSGRANANLLGGTAPSNDQTVMYMLRNDLLTNVDNARDEVAYLLREGAPYDVADLQDYLKACTRGLDAYLNAADPDDVSEARRIVARRMGPSRVP